MARAIAPSAFDAPQDAVQNGASVPLPAIRRGSELYEVFTGSSGISNLPAVTEGTALTVSAIWACVSLLAGAISTLPMHIYDRDPETGERTQRHNDELWWMLNEEFCPRWVASAGWEWMVLSRLFHGDGFAEILRRGGRIVGLVPLHPLRVEPVAWSDGSRLAYVVMPEPDMADQSIRVLDQDDMLHVPSLGFNGTRSLSPLRYALRTTGAVALATQNHSAQFFANQARPDYALIAPAGAAMTKEQIETLRSQIDENHSAARGSAHRPMLLTGGLDIKTLTLPNEDAELLATRQMQVEEIARVYGVPPFMVGHNEKTTSWGSGIAEMSAGFVRFSLRRHLNAFQNEINRKFFRTARVVAEFDTFELERADLKTLFETFRAGLGRAGEPGFMTVNEVRSLINFNRVPDGDAINPGASQNAQPTA